jgi:Na+/H+ antiporter NhaD/arsenite permease-like protein
MELFNFQTITTLIVFAGVILVIAFDLIDMLLAAMIGASVLIALGVFNSQDAIAISQTAGSPIALLFGGMVVARTLVPTGAFDYVGTIYL